MRQRVDGVDLARFVALAGMMLVHLGPLQANPYDLPPASELIAGGRAAALFAVLAGVSLSLVARSAPQGWAMPRALVIRAVALFALGIALGSIDDVGIYVILPYYAVLFVLAIPLLRVGARPLLVLAALWAVLAPVASILLRRHLAVSDFSQVELGDLAHPGSLVREVLVIGVYPVGIWVAYLLLGLGLGKLDLRRVEVARGLAVVGAALMLGALAVARTLVAAGAPGGVVAGQEGWAAVFVDPAGNFPADSWRSLAAMGVHSSTPLDLVHTMGASMLVLGLALIVMARPTPLVERLTFPLRAAGSMTLTLYTVHVLLHWAQVAAGFAFVAGTYREWLAQLVLLTLAATVWRSLARRGPLESLLHVVTRQRTAPQGAPSR